MWISDTWGGIHYSSKDASSNRFFHDKAIHLIQSSMHWVGRHGSKVWPPRGYFLLVNKTILWRHACGAALVNRKRFFLDALDVNIHFIGTLSKICDMRCLFDVILAPRHVRGSTGSITSKFVWSDQDGSHWRPLGMVVSKYGGCEGNR